MRRASLIAGLASLLCTQALARPSLEIQPGTARPGELVLIKVKGASEAPTGKLGTQTLRFYPHAGRHEAVTGLSVDLKPGTSLPLEITLGQGAHAKKLEAEIEIIDPGFPARELKVDNKFVDPPASVKKQMAEDRAAFAKAFDQPFTPRLFEKDFGWPRPSLVTARFGDRRTFNGKLASQHFGVDLNGRTGDPIFAANDGTVVMVRDCYAAGKTVIIHHGGGLYTSYFHMSRILVSNNAKVKKGDKLGLVGKTGRVTGPHLHWGVKVEGNYTDGEQLLRLNFE